VHRALRCVLVRPPACGPIRTSLRRVCHGLCLSGFQACWAHNPAKRPTAAGVVNELLNLAHQHLARRPAEVTAGELGLFRRLWAAQFGVYE
jgi:hypothetical protein